jgi:hypothetical protein
MILSILYRFNSMKKTTSFIIFFACVSIAVNCQSHITFGQIFDFDINDEFHYYYADVPTNGKRITIIDKFYTNSGDSVCYVRYNDNYTSHVVWSPYPHLEYNFITSIDTICYTNLNVICDSAFINWALADTLDNYFSDTLYFSNNWCNTLIYEYNACMGCSFEGYFISVRYGEGIGIVRKYEHVDMMPPSGYDYRLRYFKKGGSECGNPDNTTENIVEFPGNLNKINVFPNPAQDKIFIQTPETEYKIEIVNILGHVFIYDTNKTEIDISNLPAGTYILRLTGKEYNGQKGFIVY